MKHIASILLLLLCSSALVAQEALSTLCRPEMPERKGNDSVLVLPFFDDFSIATRSTNQWHLGGAFVNQGYAPLPPTIGMATLDAFKADGTLYPTAASQLFTGDTLTSRPIRLDSLFQPYTRPLSAGDSVYLSFFYLPGGGYGNMWERIGDTPENQDSLILESPASLPTPSLHAPTLIGNSLIYRCSTPNTSTLDSNSVSVTFAALTTSTRTAY